MYLIAATDGNEDTIGHSQLVARYTLLLTRALGIDDRAFSVEIERGALLHDIGKIGIPDSILRKPGALTDKEREIVKEHPAKWMIWEDEPLPQSAAKLKEMGIGSIVFDPCGNRPEQGDFLSVMRQNVENLGEIFREQR